MLSNETTIRKDIMFEYLYLNRVFSLVEQNPTEAMRCAAATAIAITLSAHYTQRVTKKTELETMILRRQAAADELRLAEIKLKQTPDM